MISSKNLKKFEEAGIDKVKNNLFLGYYSIHNAKEAKLFLKQYKNIEAELVKENSILRKNVLLGVYNNETKYFDYFVVRGVLKRCEKEYRDYTVKFIIEKLIEYGYIKNNTLDKINDLSLTKKSLDEVHYSVVSYKNKVRCFVERNMAVLGIVTTIIMPFIIKLLDYI